MKQKFDPEKWLLKKEEFNPLQWLPQKESKKQAVSSFNYPERQTSIQYEVEVIIQRIDAYQIDLTIDYSDWLKLGFAFAAEFGELGQQYFRRVSRFHPDYNMSECDKQFEKCLKSCQSRVSIKTFFWMAKHAGIDIRVD